MFKQISTIEDLHRLAFTPRDHFENERALKQLLRRFVLTGRLKTEVNDSGVYTHRFLVHKFIQRAKPLKNRSPKRISEKKKINPKIILEN